MSDGSKIEWTEATWNPIAGCSIVSPGCTNCYAMRQAARIERMIPTLEHYKGLTKPTKAGPVWTGKVALAPERTLLEPLWRKKSTTYFVNSMSDLFHEAVPDEWIDRIFAVMALAPQHTFQVLTKRSERMRAYCALPSAPLEWVTNSPGRINLRMLALNPERDDVSKREPVLSTWPLPNVWLGVSCERQQEADARIPDLLATPAAVRFVSLEPLLGPIDLTAIKGHYRMGRDYRDRDGTRERMNVLNGSDRREHLRTDGTWNHRRLDDPDGDPCFTGNCNPRLDWVIVGGESGRHARSMHIDWAREIVAQCQGANIPVFVKQLGARPTWQHSGAPFPIHHTKGADMSEWPPELRVREMPHR